MAECIFCKIAAKQIPAQIVYEDEQSVAFRDLNPQAPTHVLIVPKKHIPSLAAAGDEDKALLGHLQRVAAIVARRGGVASDFRLVANNGRGAGQSVDHLHYHLLGGRAMQWPPG
ncbi:MAG TPA: histidine triad nucleotide-binding protein [Elusimicrobia bacterium]|nr:histidine triad nucleotide-binding protein [Elusimicrobiota bacterium]HBT61485.1 histidine triad nucleotide-binding protein [Elusimicrobiota bacterium]